MAQGKSVVTWFTFLELLHFSGAAITTSFVDFHRDSGNFEFRQVSRLHSKRIVGRSSDAPVDLRSLHGPWGGCLINLVNYRGVDILPPEDPPLPLVISRYEIVKISYAATKMTPGIFSGRKFPLTQIRTLPYGRSLNGSRKNPFPFCPHYNPTSQCNDIPQVDRSAKVRPWVCEVHLYLYPPRMREDGVFYEWDGEVSMSFFVIPGVFKRFWYHDFDEARNMKESLLEVDVNANTKLLVVSRPQYDILIPDQGRSDPFLVKAWTNSLTVSREAFMHYDFNYVYTGKEMFILPLDNESHGLHGLELIWLCRYCTFDNFLTPIQIRNPISRSVIDTLVSEEHSRNIGKIFWNHLIDWKFMDVFQAAFDNENLLPEYIRFLQFHERQVNPYTLEEFRWEVDAALMKFVMVNMTATGVYILSDWITQLMYSPKTSNPSSTRRAFDSSFLIFPSSSQERNHVKFHPVTLRFVSCGHEEIRSPLRAFTELASIFEASVWLTIGVSVVIVSYIAYLYDRLQRQGDKASSRSPMTLFDWSLSCGKILLEQGPIDTKLISKDGYHSIRILLLAYFMVSIVLTNAFRNENVTQVTLPRAAIPFDTFESLLDYGFSIFTRGTFYGSTTIYRKSVARSVFLNFFQPKGNISDQHFITNLFISEVFLFAKPSFKNWYHWEHPPTSLTAPLQRILNSTRLHPHWFNTLLFGDVQEEDILNECNQTALFLTDPEAHALYYNLKAKHLNAFVGGSELNLMIEEGIVFARWLNPFILRRFNALRAGAVWDWWTEILVKFMMQLKGGPLNEKVRRPKASNMGGNISVVFMILAAGVLISCLTFCSEKWRTHCQYAFMKLAISRRRKRKRRIMRKDCE